MTTHHNVTTTLSLTDTIELTFSGDYTEGYPGVMYHQDGSGTPPEPSEFEIKEISCNNLADLICEIDDFHSERTRKALDHSTQFVDDVVKIFTDELTEDQAIQIDKIKKNMKTIYLGDDYSEFLRIKCEDILDEIY